MNRCRQTDGFHFERPVAVNPAHGQRHRGAATSRHIDAIKRCGDSYGLATLIYIQSISPGRSATSRDLRNFEIELTGPWQLRGKFCIARPVVVALNDLASICVIKFQHHIGRTTAVASVGCHQQRSWFSCGKFEPVNVAFFLQGASQHMSLRSNGRSCWAIIVWFGLRLRGVICQ